MTNETKNTNVAPSLTSVIDEMIENRIKWQNGTYAASNAEWSCPAYVPVSQLIYAAFRSNAKGLFPPNDECRRLGL